LPGVLPDSLRLVVAAEALAVGNRKQLFIDHRFIEASKGISLKVNPPVVRPEPVLWSEKPWEAFSLAYYSVAADEGLFKMWYAAFDGDAWGKGSERGKVLVCYATSRDGFRWEKPDLGLVEYKGSRNNNIILDRGWTMKTMSVFIDPNGPREKRYKMIYDHPGAQGVVLFQPGGDYTDKRVATSPDGLHWTFPDSSNLKHSVDTQHIAFWDARIKKYVVYIRVHIRDDNSPMFPFVEPIESNPPVVAPKIFRLG